MRQGVHLHCVILWWELSKPWQWACPVYNWWVSSSASSFLPRLIQQCFMCYERKPIFKCSRPSEFKSNIKSNNLTVSYYYGSLAWCNSLLRSFFSPHTSFLSVPYAAWLCVVELMFSRSNKWKSPDVNVFYFSNQPTTKSLSLASAPCAVQSVLNTLNCSTNILTISWAAGSMPTNYSATALAGDGTALSCMTEDSSCTLTNLQCGQQYTVNVKAISSTCEGHSSVGEIVNSGKNVIYIQNMLQSKDKILLESKMVWPIYHPTWFLSQFLVFLRRSKVLWNVPLTCCRHLGIQPLGQCPTSPPWREREVSLLLALQLTKAASSLDYSAPRHTCWVWSPWMKGATALRVRWSQQELVNAHQTGTVGLNWSDNFIFP